MQVIKNEVFSKHTHCLIGCQIVVNPFNESECFQHLRFGKFAKLRHTEHSPPTEFREFFGTLVSSKYFDLI